MPDSLILFLYDNSERAAIGRPYQQEAAAAGFDVVVAAWRDVVAISKGALVRRGWRIGSRGESVPISDEPVEPRVLFHRKLLEEASGRLIEKITGGCPSSLSSYHPAWRWIGEKWILESCFRQARIAVPRPRTYLVNKFGIPETLRLIGHARPLIFKPADASLCNGITLSSPDDFDLVAEHVARSTWPRYVVQDLVGETLMYEGRRFDLRIYALVTSFRPLRFMVPREGLVRLAARKCDPEKPVDPSSILTGSAYRKRLGLAVQNLTITDLLRDLTSRGVDMAGFWDNIESLLRSVFTAFACAGPLAEASDLARYFYLAGLDVLMVPCGDSYSLLFLETNYVPNLVGRGSAVDVPILERAHREWISYLRGLTSASSSFAR
jgi:hypothetical protein